MTTFVPHWLELVILIAAFAIGIFRAIASILEALHELLDNERKERIRERIVDFWLRTAELEFAAKLQRALRSRYMQMRQVRRTYLKLFAFLIALLVLIGGHDLLSTKEIEGSAIAAKAAVIDFDFRARLLRTNAYSNAVKNTESRQNDCIARSDYDPREYINSIAAFDRLKELVFNEIEFLSKHPIKLWLAAFTSQTVSLLFLAMPLLIALGLSFNITLWILSKITESKVRLILIIAVDIAVALIMPPLLTSAMLLSSFLFVVFGMGNAIDFTTFAQPNWLTIGISGASITLHALYILPLGFSYVLLVLPGIASIFIAPLAITIALYMAYENLTAFVVDAIKFFSFDFNETVQQALINYAIAIDLLFSMTYLIPCIALVTMHRANRTRGAFLSVTQWIADNPGGALPAMAKVLRGIADVLGEFVRRKKG